MYLRGLHGWKVGRGTAIWQQAKVRVCGFELWPRLNAGPVGDAQRR